MRLIVLLLFALLAFAQAQAPTPALPGVPAEYQVAITGAIALFSAWLVGPLTAIAKKLFGSRGVGTVVISALLSLLVSVVFSVAAAASTDGEFRLWQALIAAVLAFLRGNGEYLTLVFSNAKALRTTPAKAAPLPRAAPPADAPPAVPPSGLEDIR